jgi:hypothetical protein
MKMRRLTTALLAGAVFMSISGCSMDSSAEHKVVENELLNNYRPFIKIDIRPETAIAVVKASLLDRSFYQTPCYLNQGPKDEHGKPFHFGTEKFRFTSQSEEETPMTIKLSTHGGFRTTSYTTDLPYLLATTTFAIKFRDVNGLTQIEVNSEKSNVYTGTVLNVHAGGMVPKAVPVEHLRNDEFALVSCIEGFLKQTQSAPNGY